MIYLSRFHAAIMMQQTEMKIQKIQLYVMHIPLLDFGKDHAIVVPG